MKRPTGFTSPAPPTRTPEPSRSSSRSPRAPRTPDPREQAPQTNEPTPRDRVREAAAAERRARKDLRKATRVRKRSERAEVRRFTERRRRARIGWLVVLALVGSLAGVVALGAFSPLFALRDIQVEGATRVPVDQIVGVVDDQIGTPLPLLDFGRIEVGLGGLPLVQSYVTESRPPGTLVVRVVERTPVGLLQRDGAFQLVDSAGVVVEQGAERIPGYPVIDLPSGDVTTLPFTAAAAVLVALPNDLLVQIDSITAATADDVRFTLVGGQRVVWGGAEDSAQKAGHLTRLLAQSPTAVTEYDVSSPGVGIIRG